MADDWVKIRTDLYRDPKVCVIADILLCQDSELSRFVNQNTQRDMNVTRNVMRNVTVGALVSVWGVLRHRGKRTECDLFIKSCTLSVIDDIAEIPGFGSALAAVGWVEETEDGCVLPRFFDSYNADPSEEKKKNAERQRRFREREKAKEQGVTPVTLRNALEKRREEYLTTTPPTPPQAGGDGGDPPKPKARASPSYTSQFERFWGFYPRKAGKGAAWKAFSRLPTEDRHEATEASEAFAEAWHGARSDRRQFIPHAATWLGQRRWEDDVNEWIAQAEGR